MCYLKYITGGLENVQQAEIFTESEKRTQQREETCPADSVESLMAEMPFVDTDIEDEFVSKYINWCGSTDTSGTQSLVLPLGTSQRAVHMEQRLPANRIHSGAWSFTECGKRD